MFQTNSLQVKRAALIKRRVSRRTEGCLPCANDFRGKGTPGSGSCVAEGALSSGRAGIRSRNSDNRVERPARRHRSILQEKARESPFIQKLHLSQTAGLFVTIQKKLLPVGLPARGHMSSLRRDIHQGWGKVGEGPTRLCVEQTSRKPGTVSPPRVPH